MKILKLLAGVFLVAVLFSTWSCTKDAEPGYVTVNFNHTVGGEPLEFENMKYTAPAGHPFSVVRVKYYISKMKFLKADGTTVEALNLHYRDATEEGTRSSEKVALPEGDYTSLSFIFGLDEATNIDGGLPNTQTNINMEWPIPGDQGYHYMKFEGKYDSLGSGVIKNFNLHTGATMGNQNFVEVSLPLNSFSVDGNTQTINLQMDLMEWLQNPNDWDFEEFGPMIMMNQNAQAILKANGQSVFSISSVE